MFNSKSYKQHKNRYGILLGTITVLGLTACGNANIVKQDPIYWPKSPDTPRYVFETSLRNDDSIKIQTSQDLLMDAVTGERKKIFFNKPYDVAARGGKIVVTDSMFKHALMFDVPRQKLFRFGVRNEGILEKPVGVAMDAQQTIYIADISAKIVKVYDSLGMFLRFIGQKSDFERPVDVAVNDAGDRIYVIDTGGIGSDNHGFIIYDGAGTKLRTVIKRGTGEGEFNLPIQAAVAPDGTLYVLDAGNFRVQAFSKDGDFLRTWGKVGRDLGDFARPRGIGVDRKGNVYVTDSLYRNFQIFDSQGKLLMFVGGGTVFEDKPGNFVLPSGITVDETNRVYIVDQIMRKVDVIRQLSDTEMAALTPVAVPAATPEPATSPTPVVPLAPTTATVDNAGAQEPSQSLRSSLPNPAESSATATLTTPATNLPASDEVLPMSPEPQASAPPRSEVIPIASTPTTAVTDKPNNSPAPSSVQSNPVLQVPAAPAAAAPAVTPAAALPPATTATHEPNLPTPSSSMSPQASPEPQVPVSPAAAVVPVEKPTVSTPASTVTSQPNSPAPSVLKQANPASKIPTTPAAAAPEVTPAAALAPATTATYKPNSPTPSSSISPQASPVPQVPASPAATAPAQNVGLPASTKNDATTKTTILPSSSAIAPISDQQSDATRQSPNTENHNPQTQVSSEIKQPESSKSTSSEEQALPLSPPEPLISPLLESIRNSEKN